jgi:hypothetical protein
MADMMWRKEIIIAGILALIAAVGAWTYFADVEHQRALQAKAKANEIAVAKWMAEQSTPLKPGGAPRSPNPAEEAADRLHNRTAALNFVMAEADVIMAKWQDDTTLLVFAPGSIRRDRMAQGLCETLQRSGVRGVNIRVYSAEDGAKNRLWELGRASCPR